MDMIDWQRVTALRDEIGADDFDEVVPLFLEEVETITGELRQRADVSTLESQLHFLKGSALSLGFSAFSNLCHDGELKAGKGLGAEVDVSAVLECYEQSKQAFLIGLSQGSAA